MSNIVMIAKMTPNSEYLNYFKIIIENVNNFYVGKLIGKNFLQLNQRLNLTPNVQSPSWSWNNTHTYHQSYKGFIPECKGIVKHLKIKFIKVNQAPNVVIAKSLEVLFDKDSIRNVSSLVFVDHDGLRSTTSGLH